jgi:flagellar protein FliS
MGASPIGLMIALFDRLAVDLRRAAEAIRQGDVETRCDEINHGFLVLAQLESWLDHEKGGEPARQLAKFYSYTRAQMLRASVTQSPQLLEEQIETLLHIRTSWQQLDSKPVQGNQGVYGAMSSEASPGSPAAEPTRFSQSA